MAAYSNSCLDVSLQATYYDFIRLFLSIEGAQEAGIAYEFHPLVRVAHTSDHQRATTTNSNNASRQGYFCRAVENSLRQPTGILPFTV